MTPNGYQVLGFKFNPFNSTTAEREPEIAAYAVHPPYLDRTKQASLGSGAFFLEGARGSGKSATRLTVAKELFTGPGGPLIISLTNFNVFRPYVKGGLSIDLYATQVAFLVVETVLTWMATLTEDDLVKVKKDAKDQEKLVSSFVSNFYLNRADNSRSSSAQETFQRLDTSPGTRASLWTAKRWNQIAGVVAQIAASLGKKFADVDIGDPSAFKQLVEHQHSDGFYDPTYVLVRTVEFVRAFGFTGVLVQIDKVDETDWTGADVRAASDLIVPILSNINLHEIDGLMWSFFIWDAVTQSMRRNHGAKIRFDKIPNGEIDWEAPYLTDLVSRRLCFFSENAVRTLSDICDEGLDVDSMLAVLIELTGRSPRQLISALDRILSSHIQRTQGGPLKLDDEAFQLGMDEYAQKYLTDAGYLDDARTIAKMELLEFVTKDVQGLIRQSAQTARGVIDAWLNQGLIRQFGTRPTGGAGRPVDEFQVSDPRVIRVMARKL